MVGPSRRFSNFPELGNLHHPPRRTRTSGRTLLNVQTRVRLGHGLLYSFPPTPPCSTLLVGWIGRALSSFFFALGIEFGSAVDVPQPPLPGATGSANGAGDATRSMSALASALRQIIALRSANLVRTNRRTTAKIIAVETPNMSAPSAASSALATSTTAT
jgi:hypothetical protein